MAKSGGREAEPNILGRSIELLRKSPKYTSIPIHGTSMDPLIRDGDELLVDFSPRHIVRGDVVVFSRDGTLYAHRVLSISRYADHTHFLVKGDNRYRCDPVIAQSELIGQVRLIRRASKQLSLDTRLMRGLGWTLAAKFLVSAKIDEQVERMAKRFDVAENSLAVRAYRRSNRGLLSLFRRLALLICARWQPLNGPSSN